MKLKNSTCDTTNKLKLWRKEKNYDNTQLVTAQIVTKLKKSNCDKTKKKTWIRTIINLWEEKLDWLGPVYNKPSKD